MLTLFALPKAFTGIYKTIQENAIQSWLKLTGEPEIILFGDELGTADIANKYGIKHMPDVKRNKAGTPFVNYIFHTAAEQSKHAINCYVNSDIILDPDLLLALRLPINKFTDCLQIALRWDVNLNTAPKFNNDDWFTELEDFVQKNGNLSDRTALDIFVYPKDLYRNMPQFTIGWPGGKYDNWIIWYARSHGIPVVDFTQASMLIHQNHPMNPQNSADESKKKEHIINLKLAGGYGHCYDIDDVNYRLDSNLKINKNNLPKDFIWRYAKRYLQYFIDPIRYRLFYRV